MKPTIEIPLGVVRDAVGPDRMAGEPASLLSAATQPQLGQEGVLSGKWPLPIAPVASDGRVHRLAAAPPAVVTGAVPS